MSRIVCLSALAIASCAGPTEITGPYADRLSRDDVRQIKAFVGRGLDIAGPSFRIYVSRPDHAIVQSRLDSPRLDFPHNVSEEHFDVTKRHGRWTLDDPGQFMHVYTGHIEPGPPL